MAVNGGAQQCFISHVLLMIDIVYDGMTDFLSLLHYKLVDRQDRQRILNQRAERESDRVLAAVSVINQHVSILLPIGLSVDRVRRRQTKRKKKMSKSHNTNKYDKGSAVFLVKGRMLWVFVFS